MICNSAHYELCNTKLQTDFGYLLRLQIFKENEDRTQAEETSQKCNKSWSSIVEAISRCVAAFQKARLATEQSEIQWKIIDYAMVLLSRIPPWREPNEYIHAIHEFVLNRAQNLALISINQQFFSPEAPRPYCLLQAFVSLNPHSLKGTLALFRADLCSALVMPLVPLQ